MTVQLVKEYQAFGHNWADHPEHEFENALAAQLEDDGLHRRADPMRVACQKAAQDEWYKEALKRFNAKRKDER
jgi:hypothetical protein